MIHSVTRLVPVPSQNLQFNTLYFSLSLVCTATWVQDFVYIFLIKIIYLECMFNFRALR